MGAHSAPRFVWANWRPVWLQAKNARSIQIGPRYFTGIVKKKKKMKILLEYGKRVSILTTKLFSALGSNAKKYRKRHLMFFLLVLSKIMLIHYMEDL